MVVGRGAEEQRSRGAEEKREDRLVGPYNRFMHVMESSRSACSIKVDV